MFSQAMPPYVVAGGGYNTPMIIDDCIFNPRGDLGFEIPLHSSPRIVLQVGLVVEDFAR